MDFKNEWKKKDKRHVVYVEEVHQNINEMTKKTYKNQECLKKSLNCVTTENVFTFYQEFMDIMK